MNNKLISFLLVLVLLSSMAVAKWAWVEDDEHQALQAEDVIIEDNQASNKMKAACEAAGAGAGTSEYITFGALKCPTGNIDKTNFNCYRKNTNVQVRPLAFYCSRCPSGSRPTSLYTDRGPGPCMKKAVCEQGMTKYSAQTGYCSAGNVCPTGTNFRAGVNGVDTCTGQPACVPGFGLNRVTLKCERTPVCDSGFYYNSNLKACEATPICPTGSQWDSIRRACIQRNAVTCPSGSVLDSTNGICTSDTAAQCPTGSTRTNDLTCTGNPTTCPPGTTKNSAGACIKILACEPGYTKVNSEDCQISQTFLKLDMTLQ